MKIDLDGSIVDVQFILPDPIKEFLKRNTLTERDVLGNLKWEHCIYEDLVGDEGTADIDFTQLTVVINYLHFSQENKIRVDPQEHKGNKLASPTWVKGTFFENFTIGYEVFGR